MKVIQRVYSALFFSVLALTPITSIHAEVWDTVNDPSRFDFAHDYHYRLGELPLKATLPVTPWSETYWPSFRGSINIRWNTPDQDGFKYTPPTREQVAAMSLEDLKKLAPSEKYDLFMGHYDYPLFTEVKRYANPNAGEYTGLCDGWAMTAIQYAEPKPITLPNPDGILIPFGSSDIKALMTFAAEFHFRRQTVRVGRECLTDHPQTPDEILACSDMNAGAMHVVLTNQIGLKQTGFVVDRQANADMWNQPTYGYEFQIVGSATSNVPGAHGVLVHAVLYYSEDLDKSYWDAVVGTLNFHFSRIKMDYILDLDAEQKVIGGTWVAGSDRPDYFWIPTNHLEFTGSLDGINRLLQP